jgi:hypothetical protein
MLDSSLSLPTSLRRALWSLWVAWAQAGSWHSAHMELLRAVEWLGVIGSLEQHTAVGLAVDFRTSAHRRVLSTAASPPLCGAHQWQACWWAHIHALQGRGTPPDGCCRTLPGETCNGVWVLAGVVRSESHCIHSYATVPLLTDPAPPHPCWERHLGHGRSPLRASTGCGPEPDDGHQRYRQHLHRVVAHGRPLSSPRQGQRARDVTKRQIVRAHVEGGQEEGDSPRPPHQAGG